MVENVSRRVVPGDWYAVVVGPVVVAVPPSARGRVAELWDLAEQGAGFDSLLDAVVSGGLSALPSFALVEHGEVTRVLARGAVEVVLHTGSGTHLVRPVPGAVWAEELVTGVLGGALVLAEESDDEAADLRGQVVRAARVEFGVTAPVEDAAEAGAEAPEVVVAPADAEVGEDVEPAEAVEPFADPLAASVVEPVAEPFEAAPVEPVVPVETPVAEAPVAEPEPFVEDVVEAPAPEPEPFRAEPEAPPVPDALSAPLPPEEFSAPVFPPAPQPDLGVPAPGGFAGAVVPPPAPVPGGFAAPSYEPALPQGDVEDTIIGSSPTSFERPAPVGAEQAPAVLAKPVATLVVSTGDLVDVDRAILVGRAPEARRFASEDKPSLLSVPSPQQEISSTHLEIRPGAGVDHGMAVVTDLGSTNGTVLVQPGLPPEDLQAGIAVALIPGAILDLGDGVTIQVTNP